MKDKAELRRELLEKRRALPVGEAEQRSAVICQRLNGLDRFRTAARVLTYVGSKDKEVDTKPLIAKLLKEGRPVAVPISDAVGGMRWVRIRSVEELRVGRFGILEPEAAVEEVDAESWGVCVVPGIAFDIIGHRIGYGKGYFDRFLVNFSGLSIGVAYEFQVLEAVPCDPHDRTVDLVLTETRLLCSGRSSA